MYANVCQAYANLCRSRQNACKITHLQRFYRRIRVIWCGGFCVYNFFVNRFGEVQHQGTLNKALRRIMRDCNGEILENNDIDDEPVLLPCFSCHVLRHTFATRMCESGLNVKVVQSVLGHADVTTTLQIYVTVSNEMKKREILTYSNYIRTGERQVQNI
ncbi:hypothetical protein DW088_15545 [Butyricicoccus sp. AM05-1]|nr:hypothetical protein DW088_15545 [Butyricicoccus sp. AM05-1]